MSKKELIKHILIELDDIPEQYLGNIYEIIHTFRVNVAVKHQSSKKDDENFDWDGLVEEIYQDREKVNKDMESKIKGLF
ncbi:MAG: hypothetical protein K9I94_10455 [Bacteroidales bacterium]|nr:hypothetical protein [Bacteroidales bacterium]